MLTRQEATDFFKVLRRDDYEASNKVCSTIRDAILFGDADATFTRLTAALARHAGEDKKKPELDKLTNEEVWVVCGKKPTMTEWLVNPTALQYVRDAICEDLIKVIKL